MLLAVALLMRPHLFVVLAACSQTFSAPSPPPKQVSHQMDADEHIVAARDEDERARELASWPTPRRDDVGGAREMGRFDDPPAGLWYRHWGEQPAEHLRRAEAHRGAAAELHAAYDDACAGIAPAFARKSPLARYGQGDMPTEDGVVIFLGKPGVTTQQIRAELRCYQAWTKLSEIDEDGPLDLPDLRIVMHEDDTGISIELQLQDLSLLPELQRRAARTLEVAER